MARQQRVDGWSEMDTKLRPANRPARHAPAPAGVHGRLVGRTDRRGAQPPATYPSTRKKGSKPSAGCDTGIVPMMTVPLSAK